MDSLTREESHGFWAKRHWMGRGFYADDSVGWYAWRVEESGGYADLSWTEDVYGGLGDRSGEVVYTEPGFELW